MLTAHMIVKNEDRFVWFAISSVLPYLDKFIIYDTGSTDRTVEIIKSIQDAKIEFRKYKISYTSEIAKLRNSQIQETSSDWFWIVDGDEIYPDSLCREIKEILKKEGDKLEGIVAGRYDLLGDIYHYQDESVGAYNMLGKSGHMALRLINKKNIPGLYVAGNYPYEEYFDKDGTDVIFHKAQKFRFTQGKLFHVMYLPRSSKGANLGDTFHRSKYKLESGHKFPQNTIYPEVFRGKKTPSIADVTKKRSLFYEIGACLLTPIKMMKRKFK